MISKLDMAMLTRGHLLFPKPDAPFDFDWKKDDGSEPTYEPILIEDDYDSQEDAIFYGNPQWPSFCVMFVGNQNG